MIKDLIEIKPPKKGNSWFICKKCFSTFSVFSYLDQVPKKKCCKNDKNLYHFYYDFPIPIYYHKKLKIFYEPYAERKED